MISYEGNDFYPIPNLEKYYISKCGKLLSTNRKNPIIMKLRVNYDGYRSILIKHKSYFIHRLLVKTFFKNFDEDLQVDHIDNDKLNNNLSNLRMVTHSNNQRNKLNAFGYRIKKDGFVECYWRDDNCKEHSKSYAIKKYGFAFAFLLATNVREEMVAKYYNRV
jgi:hypothetical protein